MSSACPTHRRVVIIVFAEDSLNRFRDGRLVVWVHPYQRERALQVAAKREWELTERDVGEEVMRDMIVRNLGPWRKSDVGHARIGRCDEATYVVEEEAADPAQRRAVHRRGGAP